MAVAPTSFASPLIAALRGGISDTGSASTVSLLPNMAPNYSGAAAFKPIARTGNINNVQPFAPMPIATPSFEPDPFLEEMMSGPPVYNDFKLNTLELQKTEPEPEPEVPDYTEDLWPAIEQAPANTEPPPAISYPISMPSVIESSPLQPEPAPSVETIQSTNTNLEPVLTDPATALFELDRELGDIQQWDVMEPVANTPPAFPEDFGYVAPAPAPEPVPAFPEDFGYVEPTLELVPAFPEDFGYSSDPIELADQDLFEMALFDMLAQDQFSSGGSTGGSSLWDMYETEML